MKFVFGIQRNSKIFYKLILSFLMLAARHAQSTQNRKFVDLCKQACQKFVSRLAKSTQNNKFAIFLKYLKENGKNKHERFFQFETIILGVLSHAKITQNNRSAISLQYLKGILMQI